MKNTSIETQKILSAIKGLGETVGNRMDHLDNRMDRLENGMERLETHVVDLREGQEGLTLVIQGLATHMDLRFDEADRKMAKANALAASGPVL